MSKFTEGSWQWWFAVYSKQWKSSWNFKAFFCTKKCLERIPHDIYIYFYKNLLVNLPTGSPSSSNHCRCTVAYSAILPTILGFLSVQKKIRKSWSSQPKIKPTTCGYSGPGISEKPKKLRLYFATRRKPKAWTEVKENHFMVNCICDQILSENICRNINHRN